MHAMNVPRPGSSASGAPGPERDPLSTTAWVGLHVLALAAMLWLWDAVLLKRHLDNLPLMGGILAGCFLIALLLRRVAGRAGGARPAWLGAAWRSLGRRELVYVALFLVLLLALHIGYDRARSDGRAYFIQVRSLVLDLDFDFEPDRASFGFASEVSNYAFGTPLLWAPFFLAAHAWLHLLNLLGASYPVDGFFNPYQRAVGVGSLVYGTLGLLLIDRTVRRYFSGGVATLATVSVCIGGFAVWYLAMDPSYSHAVSMFAVTAFLYAWDTTRQERSGRPRTGRQWVVLGGMAGLMAMTRWQNALFAVVPAVEAVRDYARLLARGDWHQARALFGRHLLFSACILAAFSPQALVWKMSRGSWFALPTQGHAVHWLDPEPSRELLSPDRGLFAWAPLLLLATIGLLLFLKRQPWVGTLFVLALVAQIYISSTIVSIGHGHAARKLTSCTLIFVLGLAALLEWLRRHPLVAPVAVIAALTAVNFLFMLDLRTTRLEQAPVVPALRIVESATSRLGNPFLVPWNLWFAWRYETRPTHWEMIDTQTYNNVPIDVGSEGDEKFLGIGWSDRERLQSRTARWAVGRRATVLAKLKEADRYFIELTGAAFRYPGAPAQIVRVFANNVLVGELEIRALGDYRVIAEKPAMRTGLNVVRFEFDRATSPRSVGVSEDQRPLAVLFDEIRLLRRPGG